MYIYVMRFQISYIKLHHTLYSINYGNCEGAGPLMHMEKIQAHMWKVRMLGKYMKATDEDRRQIKMKWKLQDKKRMCKY